MEFELGNIFVAYPSEDMGLERKLRLRPDSEVLHFDFLEINNVTGCMTLDKEQVELLIDTLKLILKNKLIE